MYNVSQAFLDVVKQPAQEHRIQGIISGSLGNTSFDESNIKSGTFHVTNQSTDTNDVVLGSVYVGTLTATFYGLDSHIDRYSWIGRRITPSFGLRIGTNEWENVPLGIFTVKEAVHTAEGIEITAYDDMIKFDKKFKPENFQFQGGMWAFVDQVCEDCSVDNGMTDEYIESLPNGDKDLMIAGAYGPLKDFANDIETYRDLVFWMAQTMACFATINRDGALEFRQYKSVDNYVDTITETHRLAGATFDDYVTNYTGVWYKNIKEGTDSYYGYDPEELEAALQRSQDHLVDLEGQLTQLEADYAAGRISETEYKAQKKELNRRIKNVKKRIKWEMDALEHIEDGSFMEMGANPFLQTGTGESVIEMRNNVLNALDAISYTPFSCSTVVGVHYDLGDIIQFTGGHATEAGEACCLMMYDYNLNGAYVMEGFGVDPAIPMVHNTNEKSANAANKNGLSAGRTSVGKDTPESGKTGDLHVTTSGFIEATDIYAGTGMYLDSHSGDNESGYNANGHCTNDAADESIYFKFENLVVGATYTLTATVQIDGVLTNWGTHTFAIGCRPTDAGLYGLGIPVTPGGTTTVLDDGAGVAQTLYYDNDAHDYEMSFTASETTYYAVVNISYLHNTWYSKTMPTTVTNLKLSGPSNDSPTGIKVYNNDQWQNIDFVRSVEQKQTSGTKIATAHNSDGTTADIYAPASKVDDVKVDGISVVENKIANINTMIGASASEAGAKGLVPAPAQGDEEKFLRGDGTWAQGGGGTTVVANPTGTATANLNKLQIDETIYQIVGGGSGGSGSGFSADILFDGSDATGLQSSVTLTAPWTNYDAIAFVCVEYYKNREYRHTHGIILKDVLQKSLETLSTNGGWIDINAQSESVYAFAKVESITEFTNIYGANTIHHIDKVYGLIFSAGSEYTETSLFSGTSRVTNMVLSDSMSNYDAIEFYTAWVYNGITYHNSSIALTSQLLTLGQYTVGTSVYRYVFLDIVDDTHINWGESSDNIMYMQQITGIKFGSGSGGTGGASAISDLTDVELTNLSDGQILQYNSVTQKWENADNQGSGQVSALSYQQLTPTEYENLTTAEKNNGTIYFVSENSTGVSGLKVITISQAEYNSLTTEQKNNGVPYFVY